MKNGIPAELIDKIAIIPSHINRNGRQHQSSLKFDRLAKTLQIIENDKAIIYTVSEFASEFGEKKHTIPMVIKALKNRKISHPRIVIDHDKVVVFSNK